MKKLKKGFTLIELLAAIVILGIISAVAVISYSKITKRSKKISIYTSINNIVDSVMAVNIEDDNDCWYRSKKDNYKLPKDIKDLEIVLIKKNENIKYEVLAFDNNDNIIIKTDDFKKLDKNDFENWVDNNSEINKYIIGETNDISNILDENFCKILKEEK